MKNRTYIIISLIVLIVAGAAVYLQLTGGDTDMSLTALLSGARNDPSSPDLKPQGRAPEFVGISKWLNTDEPVTLEALRGKVVLVDFWTYSCINCIRTLPYVTRWHDIYRDSGLVVIGVHTPEFDFEKNAGNVKAAIERHGIHYPVAQDNDYATWRAYNNRYWPAKYLIDQNGQVVYTHFGEGEYEATERAIRSLLGLEGAAANDAAREKTGGGQVGSPEMYFGTIRIQNLTPEQSPSTTPRIYQLSQTLALNRFALAGEWKFTPEYAELVKGPGIIRLRFSASSLFMVAESEDSVIMKITVDGQAQPEVTVQASQLYTLFDSEDYKEHLIEIEVTAPGLRAFTFTFG